MISSKVVRQREPGLHVVATERGSLIEWFVLASPLPGEAPEAVFARAARALADREATILNQFVWHVAGLRDLAYQTWERILGPTSWPVSWMVDRSGTPPYAGVTIRAVSGVEVEPVRLGGRLIGASYETPFARYLLLGDLHDPEPGRTPADQTQRVLDQMIAGLESVGMSFNDVMRTWFFNQDILAWYDDFNRVRTRFFQERQVFDQEAPASTGIGTRNIHGAALIASLIAAKAHDPEQFKFYAVPSPLQQPALEYGSNFSRAVEVATPDRRHVFISGTASIEPSGKTVHVGDVVAQTELTLDVIEAILESRGMTWSDSLQGVGYVRFAADHEAVVRCLHERGLADLPILLSDNVVCRDDLLFELEIQAAKGANTGTTLPAS